MPLMSTLTYVEFNYIIIIQFWYSLAKLEIYTFFCVSHFVCFVLLFILFLFINVCLGLYIKCLDTVLKIQNYEWIRLWSHRSIRYTVFAIRNTFCSPPQMTFKWCSEEGTATDGISSVAESKSFCVQRTPLAYTSMWSQPQYNVRWYTFQ